MFRALITNHLTAKYNCKLQSPDLQKLTSARGCGWLSTQSTYRCLDTECKTKRIIVPRITTVYKCLYPLPQKNVTGLSMPYRQQQEGTDNNKPQDSSQLVVSESYTKRLPPLLCLCLTESNRKGLTTTNHMTVPSWLSANLTRNQQQGTDDNKSHGSSQLAVSQSYTKRLPPLLCLCLTYSNRKGLTTTNQKTVPSWLQQQEGTDDNKSHDSSQLAVSQSYTKRLLPQLCLCLSDGNMKGLTTTYHNTVPSWLSPNLTRNEGTDDNKSHDSSQLAVSQSYTKRLPPLYCLCLTDSNRKRLTTTNHMTVPSWLRQHEGTDNNKPQDSSQLAVSQSYAKRLPPLLCLCLTDSNRKGLTTTNHMTVPSWLSANLTRNVYYRNFVCALQTATEGTDDNKSHDSSQLAVSQSYAKRLPPLLCLCLTDSNRKGLTTTNLMTVPSWLSANLTRIVYHRCFVYALHTATTRD
ncbi:hypothetical protein J6590_005995 [Homalodisca vitripennis]|nr:hypothetical protein J6590_005995 [Homalodisca vitripennis]